MAGQPFIVATAGHVDHGKSSLVRALTGTDPDRLPEEKARGMTIELGFAHLSLVAPAPEVAGRFAGAPQTTFDLGVVDVPGHEDFVKNMVAGVGAVDVALFVVAADDGWMPQTEEHLQILSYLGVTRAVVALTKADLVEAPESVADEIRERLRGTPFAGAPIIPTSILRRTGLDELRSALADMLASAPAPEDHGKPRLPVDRAFTLHGVGTVVTGTLMGGSLHRGQAVVVQPSGLPARIRTIQRHGEEVEGVDPGTRTALNLPDVAASGENAACRGEVVTLADLGGSSLALDVLLTRSERKPHPTKLEPASRATLPLKDQALVRVHHGTAAWTARVHLLEGNDIPPGGRALARLQFESPVFAFANDRLILRDGSAGTTLAGGVVLDPDPKTRRSLRKAQRRFLDRRAADPDDLSLAVSALLERDHAGFLPALWRKSPFADYQIAAAVTLLAAKGSICELADGLVTDFAWWKDLREGAADRIDEWHGIHPEKIGLPLADLRSAVAPALPLPDLFDALIVSLENAGFVRAETAIRRVSHRPALPAGLQEAGARIRAVLSERGGDSPSIKELAPDAESRQAMRFLRETGEIVELLPELVLAAESYRRMRAAIVRFIRSEGAATTSDIRQMLGTTRRVLIPLLEHLDREGVTLRDGDKRNLR